MQSLSKKIFFCLFAGCLLVSIFFIFDFSIAQADSSLWTQAQNGGLKDIGTEAYNTNTPKDIRVVVAYMIRVFLGLLGIIFLALLVSAGYKWMMAQGEEEKIREAIKQIRNAVIGLLLVLSAYAISSFVFRAMIYSQTGNWPGAMD